MNHIETDNPIPYSYLLGKSTKINKSDKYSDYENFIMYLAPHTMSGVNICPFASKGCAAACLNTAGRGKFTMTQKARLNRTLHYLSDRVGFLKRLRAEILYHATLHEKIAIRTNGTSDLNFIPFIKEIHKTVPHVIFYDYTKNPSIALRSLETPNYHVTFSRSEINDVDCLKMLSAGINVAVVFRNKLPATWKGFEVIDGDESDTRFLDRSGVVVGLTAKGKGKKDTSGFVVD
jgi:hypothetical protein